MIIIIQDIEDKKNGLTRFMQIKCRDCEFIHSFYTSPQIDSTKDDRSKGMETMKINVRTVYSFRVSGLVIYHLLSCVVSRTCHHQRQKMHDDYLFR